MGRLVVSTLADECSDRNGRWNRWCLMSGGQLFMDTFEGNGLL